MVNVTGIAIRSVFAGVTLIGRGSCQCNTAGNGGIAGNGQVAGVDINVAAVGIGITSGNGSAFCICCAVELDLAHCDTIGDGGIYNGHIHLMGENVTATGIVVSNGSCIDVTAVILQITAGDGGIGNIQFIGVAVQTSTQVNSNVTAGNLVSAVVVVPVIHITVLDGAAVDVHIAERADVTAAVVTVIVGIQVRSLQNRTAGDQAAIHIDLGTGTTVDVAAVTVRTLSATGNSAVLNSTGVQVEGSTGVNKDVTALGAQVSCCAGFVTTTSDGTRGVNAVDFGSSGVQNGQFTTDLEDTVCAAALGNIKTIQVDTNICAGIDQDLIFGALGTHELVVTRCQSSGRIPPTVCNFSPCHCAFAVGTAVAVGVQIKGLGLCCLFAFSKDEGGAHGQNHGDHQNHAEKLFE